MNHHTRTVFAPDEVIRRPETKSFILTSEFWVAAGAAAAVLLAGYALDDIAETTAWRFFVWIAIAYVVSRGIAKAGSQRDYRADPTRTFDRFTDEYPERETPVRRETSPQPSAGGRIPREYQPSDT